MKFPELSDEFILDRLQIPEGRIPIVIDTDTFNEIDDRFALTYALKSPGRLNILSVYAAPYHNENSADPRDGMEKSYEEIQKIFCKLEINPCGLLHKGSERYLTGIDEPCKSDAAYDLIEKSSSSAEPIYVAAIAAATDIASAILLEPEIIRKIVVIWLGGNPPYWPASEEFNLSQDILAAKVLFDSGVPLIQIPCMGVSSHLLTTLPELEKHIYGKSSIGNYLTDTFRNMTDDHYAWAKEIWDISAIARLINPEWVPVKTVPRPALSDDGTFREDNGRLPMQIATYVDRNEIFADLFRKI